MKTCWVLGVTLLATLPVASQGQEKRCVEFDAPYFGFSDVLRLGPEAVTSSRVIELLPEPNDEWADIPFARRVHVELHDRAAQALGRMFERSYWTMPAPDSLDIYWGDGFVINQFMMGEQGDSLVGTRFFSSDTGPFTPEPYLARARWVDCPKSIP